MQYYFRLRALLKMSASYADKERQLRSVFVGNIPFDVTEGELREKFEQAGPIVSFRLVHDRDSGKPKGYGFIEYQDAATANSCVRNLNNVEYNGRPLRVGPAAGGDQSSTENIKALQQALGGLQQESAHGPAVDPTEAPEAISKAVSSLPPEQMFELMKQMKLCIQNNPSEARSMLLQNPQLAYALLQAQIVMKIVDPQVAMALLHRDRENIPAVKPEDTPKPAAAVGEGFRGSSGGLLGERPGEPVPSASRQPLLESHGPSGQERWGGSGLDPRSAPHGMRAPESMRDLDTRSRDPRVAPPVVDPRSGSRGTPSVMDPRRAPAGLDSRGPPPNADPRREARGHPTMDRGMPMDRREAMRSQDVDYRNMDRGRPGADFSRGSLLDAPDPRQSGSSRGGMPPSSQFSPRQGGHPPRSHPPASGAEEDKEKAALIMQVLQLTDEQIQQLPPDQRQSILILKDQISRQQ